MSKEKIYTIPVNEAFNEVSECPFCKMYETLEDHMLEFVLGNSYMEDDIREQTNRLGFCKKHYADLNNGKNPLGLALILHTHMKKLHMDMKKIMESEIGKSKPSGFSFKKGNDSNPLFDYSDNQMHSCYICERINKTFDDYVDTFFYLWKTDKDFIDKVKNSSGFCMHHFALVLALAQKKLSKSAYQEFVELLWPLQEANFQRVLDDLEWFTMKFDYRFKDEPWKNSQDAIPRAIQKISSIKL